MDIQNNPAAASYTPANQPPAELQERKAFILERMTGLPLVESERFVLMKLLENLSAESIEVALATLKGIEERVAEYQNLRTHLQLTPGAQVLPTQS